MKVSKNWLKELVDNNTSDSELITLFNDKTIGTKEVTDEFIELDMKGYNRADLLSMHGVAYEVAAITDSRVKFQEPGAADYIWVEKSLDSTRVEIKESQLASIQAVAKIEGLKAGPSPVEWVKKLNASGMRSVNTIVDATNLIMLEFGHPLHAFDAKNVRDDTIIVRKAADGEEITTLDGKKRHLISTDIVLADDDKALDVAGVMGGKDTEVTEKTQTILLSASLFNPEMIRQTVYRLGLHSEASKRFYHGLTGKRLLQALDASIRMYLDLGGKLTSLTIIGETDDQLKKIPFRLNEASGLIGEDISPEQAEQYFKRLNFTISDKVLTGDKSSYVITPPYYRLDLELEADITEEIARLYGYENIKASEVPDIQIASVDQTKINKIRKYKNELSNLGMTEVFTYPYYSTSVLESLGFTGEYFDILNKIANPISKETEYLRLNLWPNLLEAAARNFKQGFKEPAIFELGKVYSVNPDKKPFEEYHLAAVLINNTDQPIQELYSILKAFLKNLGPDFTIEKSSARGVAAAFYHPKRFMAIKQNQLQIGGISEIHSRLTDAFNLPKRVAVLEITLP